ncbi:hypothetical protein ROZALSC1DRAFT_24995 [Rozella allomycis CSF55]|uniref:Uncharacterized protein n=1 Tax=Rozella allomycis (strain CSF55) TaxID=988480 RepID=A0A4P9YCE3_ROZAC|nr:hypothetical protein ROZALSC1DRAFT_24995 [Rozella allomycis CSF55]
MRKSISTIQKLKENGWNDYLVMLMDDAEYFWPGKEKWSKLLCHFFLTVSVHTQIAHVILVQRSSIYNPLYSEGKITRIPDLTFEQVKYMLSFYKNDNNGNVEDLFKILGGRIGHILTYLSEAYFHSLDSPEQSPLVISHIDRVKSICRLLNKNELAELNGFVHRSKIGTNQDKLSTEIVKKTPFFYCDDLNIQWKSPLDAYAVATFFNK